MVLIPLSLSFLGEVVISEGEEPLLTVPSPGPLQEEENGAEEEEEETAEDGEEEDEGEEEGGDKRGRLPGKTVGFEQSTGGRAEGDPPGGSVLDLPALPQSPISGSSDEEEEEDDDEGPVMKRTADEEVWAGLWARRAVRDHVDMAPDPCGARAGARELGWDPGSPVTPRHFNYLNSSPQDEVDPKRQKTENGASA